MRSRIAWNAAALALLLIVGAADARIESGRAARDERTLHGDDLDGDGEGGGGGGGGGAAEPEDVMDEEAASSSFDDRDVPAVPVVEVPDAEHLESNFERQNGKEEDEDALFAIQEMKARLRPRGPLDPSPIVDGGSNATRQFAHLHHMKTGGTSVNRLISCALNRARRGDRDALPFSSLEECGMRRYKQCTEGTDSGAKSCRDRIDTAAAMQFCAPLFQMERFGWLDESRTDVVTVIRHPVDRVWSMFRFQTKRCYACAPLVEVYRQIDAGTVKGWCADNLVGPGGRPGGRGRVPPARVEGAEGRDPVKMGPGGPMEEESACPGVCIPQLLNHQTRNLMTTPWESPEGMAMTDDDRIAEALHNLDKKIAVVGVTDELPAFAAILGEVFPWMAPELRDGGRDGKVCNLPHANASPENNRCGADGGHWDLPDHPDDETAEAIMRHNAFDLRLYEEAKRRFGYQKRALGMK